MDERLGGGSGRIGPPALGFPPPGAIVSAPARSGSRLGLWSRSKPLNFPNRFYIAIEVQPAA